MRSFFQHLPDEIWDGSADELPPIREMMQQILDFPRPDWIGISLRDPEMRELERLRLAGVCMFDAGTYTQNAWIILRSTIAICQYTQVDLPNDVGLHEPIEFSLQYSVLLSDYVPLLLYVAARHALESVCQKYELHRDQDSTKLLKTVRDADLSENSQLAAAVEAFAGSQAREEVWAYRSLWTHQQAPAIDFPFRGPRRHLRTGKGPRSTIETAFVDRRHGAMVFALMGAYHKPDYSWDAWMQLLTEALRDSVAFVTACANEWEAWYIDYSAHNPFVEQC